MAFDPDAYVAKFSPDAYLARHAPPAPDAPPAAPAAPGRGRGPRHCRRCGAPGHNARTCDAGEFDRLFLIAERAKDLDQVRRLTAAPPAEPSPAEPPQEPREFVDFSEFLPPEPAPEPVELPPQDQQPDPSVNPVSIVGTARIRRTPHGRIRPKTIAPNALGRDVRRELKEDSELDDRILLPILEERPKTRGDCQNGPRPCPFASCRHHLYLDVNPESGAIKFNFPHLEVWDVPETCSLDVAERDGVTLEEAGRLIAVTRERARQIENGALKRIHAIGGGPHREDLRPPDGPVSNWG